MIPIRDTIQSRNYPVITIAIIAFNVLLFFLEMTQGPGLDRFILTYGLVPARYTVPEIAAYFTPGQQVLSLFSFMFLHGGFWHLLGNMWSLYIFGDNVEDRLGPMRYLLFYILSGWTSGVFHLLVNWNSTIPTIGASGAIAGVMGAYFVLYPRSRILTLIPILFIPYFLEIPAYVFLGIWFLMQFLNVAGPQGGIAWWAHIGGFVFGILFLKLFLRIPRAGITTKMRQLTSKSKTPRLQVIRTRGFDDDPHLYGDMPISPTEAQLGTIKLVNIPWGFQKRLFRVRVPPGISDGTKLRLSGMGKRMHDGRTGDLYLQVVVQP